MVKQLMQALSKLFNILFYLLNLLLLLVVMAPYVSITISNWWLDNLLSLQLQWFLLALILLLISIKKAHKWSIILSLLSLIIIVYRPLSSDNINKLPFNADTLNVAQLNLRYQNSNIDNLLIQLSQADYDLLSLQEVGDNWHHKIQVLTKTYPHSIGSSTNNASPSGLVLFSRWPIVEQKIHNLDYQGGHIIEALLQSPHANKPVQIFALHPASPRDANLWHLRNAALETVAQLVSRSPLNYKIIIGDLNITPWSTHFKRLQQDSLLTNTSNAFTYIPSWSYNQTSPFLRLLSSAYIDHCLISPHFTLLNKITEKIQGSDHLLIVTELGMQN
jgi:endonuclease/exonuclease/phosphatase (EEP) superfamily protein YafD